MPKLRETVIRIIPHDKHRYETVGDYWYHGDTREVRISDMNDEDCEFLVTIHELVEAHLCRKHGIDENAITAFDVAFEENRKEGNVDEPGDSPEAPYQKEHQFATKIEKLIAEELGINWEEYDKLVVNL
jgi:hypothetical protein